MNQIAEAAGYTTNEKGERIIASTRRADGTLRKERKVKPGYIPQDEQPMYVSRGSMVKQNIPKCPGMPEAEAAAPKLSKTARKNAKRKEQRQAAAEGTGGDSSSSTADGAAGQLQHLRLDGNSALAGPSGSKQAASSHTAGPTPHQQAGRAAASHTQYPPGLEVPPGFEPSSRGAGVGSSALAVEKQTKALRKKIRSAEATEQKQKEGKPLLPEEIEKLERVKEWRHQLLELEEA
eukprot:jgi/Astpho2/8688/Aster-05258